MTKPLHSLLVLFLLLFLHQSHAQVSLISNNTNLTSGFVLPNGTPLLRDEEGYLWTTNGTIATQVSTAVTYQDSLGAVVYNNLFYFAGKDATTGDIELWATDGTSSGTKLINNISSASSSTPDNFFVLNNILYFTANNGSSGKELWKSNGSVGNSSLVADINTGPGDGIEDNAGFFQNGNTVFFSAIAAGDTGVWKIDISGTPALLKNFSGNILLLANIYCTALGSKTIFTVQSGEFFQFTDKTELWITDGTSNNTSLLKDFGNGSGVMFPQFTLFNGTLFFDGTTATNTPFQPDIELWTTDGTTAHTTLFKDIQPGSDASDPLLLGSAVINNKLYFSATTKANGTELWYTDGTAGNTKIFTDINQGSKNSEPAFLADFGVFTGLTSAVNFNYLQLYSSIFKGKLYFTADDGKHGVELWSTDGTSGGTQIVKDINPNKGDGADAGNLAFYTTTGIYFVGDNGSTGTEPWFTDGTANGTNIVADVNTTAKKGSAPQYEFLYNNQIYFEADNGDNAGGNTDLYKINQSVVVLPVNMLSFTAALNAGNVSLNWKTATEANTSRFEVERSTDGIHFNTLGTVAAAGISTATHQYQYSDGNVLQAGASTLYYRIRIVDKDGRYTYTATLPVQLQGGKFTITLSPNPVHNQLTVAFTINNAKKITLQVTDAHGKPVYQQQFQANGFSALQQNINVARFAAGTYFIQLITEKETKTATFIKQ